MLIKPIKQILVSVCQKLHENNINYLVYGSMARQFYGEKDIIPNDIDIIVSERNFDEIEKIFDNDFDIFRSKYNLHANHKTLKNNSGQPFDISFDSKEYYFSDLTFDISQFTQLPGSGVRVLPEKYLVQLYEKYN